MRNAAKRLRSDQEIKMKAFTSLRFDSKGVPFMTCKCDLHDDCPVRYLGRAGAGTQGCLFQFEGEHTMKPQCLITVTAKPETKEQMTYYCTSALSGSILFIINEFNKPRQQVTLGDLRRGVANAVSVEKGLVVLSIEGERIDKPDAKRIRAEFAVRKLLPPEQQGDASEMRTVEAPNYLILRSGAKGPTDAEEQQQQQQQEQEQEQKQNVKIVRK